jgi:hypothetical protein
MNVGRSIRPTDRLLLRVLRHSNGLSRFRISGSLCKALSS